MNKKEIDNICEKYNITNYTINDDGSIDVDGDVDLSNKGLTKLPLKFRKVTGGFNINDNCLTSLIGSPEYVGRWFNCIYNQLTSLFGAPKYVGNNFACDNNLLSSMKYCPQYIGSDFYCEYNQLTSLEYIPNEIDGNFNCSNNLISSLEFLPKIINGRLNLDNNNIKNINYLPKRYERLDIYNNSIYKILNLIISFRVYEYNYTQRWNGNTRYIKKISAKPLNNDYRDLIYDFNEREIIQNDILIIDRLVDFLEDNDKPQTKEYLYNLLKDDYEIH